MGRIVPTVLLFSVFMFLNAEMWKVATEMPLGLFAITLGLFAALGAVLTWLRLPSQVDELGEFGGWGGVARVRLGEPVDLTSVLAFAAALVLGALDIYCFWLILTTGAFWLTHVDFIIELFDGMYQAGRWPVTIYPGCGSASPSSCRSVSR